MAELRAGAIVTGGGSGIGLATAHRLASGGSAVVAVDVAVPGGKVDGIEFLAGDVRDGTTISRAIARLDGRIQTLVLCAAKGPYHDDPVAVVETNHHAAVMNALACEYSFVEWASVVLMSSTAGFRAQNDGCWWGLGQERWLELVDEPYSGKRKNELWAKVSAMSARDAYGLSKWALNVSTVRLGRILASRRVRVNCIAAGPTRTKMSEPAWRDRPGEWSDLVGQSPVELPCEADDVAAAVEWLCTPSAKMIFGSFVHIDGGWKLSHVE